MPNNDSNYILTYNHPHGQVLINELTLTDIADAIREQRLTDDRFKPALFAGEILGINEIEGGEYEGEIDLSVEEKDVNFYDYDGTRVYSYGKEEFLDLSSLPDNPSHDDLVAQGWNWSLSDAKEYVLNYGILNVGQMYNTYNPIFESFAASFSRTGWLEIDIELKENYLSPTLPWITSQSTYSNNQIGVYWGDQVDDNDFYYEYSHTYSQPGKYTIIIFYDNLNYSPLTSEFILSGTSSGSSLLTGGGTNDQIYRDCITAVRVGRCVKRLEDYAFKNCNSLKTITLHKDLENIGQNCFLNCYSLKSITLPKNNFLSVLYPQCFLNCYSLKLVLLSFSSYGWYYSYQNFLNCYSLKTITIPEESASGFPLSCFALCHSLLLLTIPLGITNFDNTIFTNCYSLKRINIYNDTPPTVTSTTFTGLPTYTKIYVPWSRGHSILLAYKTATYWSAIADQIYLMPMSIENTLAYAEFDSNDRSLIFFRDEIGKYNNGDTDGTKTYYTGIETDIYDYSNHPVPWYNNRSSIRSVTFEDKIKPISTSRWFWEMTNSYFTTISGLDKLNTSNVTTMECMFYNCDKLTNLDLSHFNTSNVTNMENMFQLCSSLTSLDLSHFNTSNVTSMNYMFYDCESLTSLDVSNFDTSNVTDMGNMFGGCNNLTSLDLSNFNTSNVTSMRWMFDNCHKLLVIYVFNNWDINNVSQSERMFFNCYVLIGENGTTYDSSYTDKTRAKIDGGPSDPGYLTYKAATGGAA